MYCIECTHVLYICIIHSLYTYVCIILGLDASGIELLKTMLTKYATCIIYYTCMLINIITSAFIVIIIE